MRSSHYRPLFSLVLAAGLLSVNNIPHAVQVSGTAYAAKQGCGAGKVKLHPQGHKPFCISTTNPPAPGTIPGGTAFLAARGNPVVKGALDHWLGAAGRAERAAIIQKTDSQLASLISASSARLAGTRHLRPHQAVPPTGSISWQGPNSGNWTATGTATPLSNDQGFANGGVGTTTGVEATSGARVTYSKTMSWTINCPDTQGEARGRWHGGESIRYVFPKARNSTLYGNMDGPMDVVAHVDDNAMITSYDIDAPFEVSSGASILNPKTMKMVRTAQVKRMTFSLHGLKLGHGLTWQEIVPAVDSAAVSTGGGAKLTEKDYQNFAGLLDSGQHLLDGELQQAQSNWGTVGHKCTQTVFNPPALSLSPGQSKTVSVTVTSKLDQKPVDMLLRFAPSTSTGGDGWIITPLQAHTGASTVQVTVTAPKDPTAEDLKGIDVKAEGLSRRGAALGFLHVTVKPRGFKFGPVTLAWDGVFNHAQTPPCTSNCNDGCDPRYCHGYTVSEHEEWTVAGRICGDDPHGQWQITTHYAGQGRAQDGYVFSTVGADRANGTEYWTLADDNVFRYVGGAITDVPVTSKTASFQAGPPPQVTIRVTTASDASSTWTPIDQTKTVPVTEDTSCPDNSTSP